MRWNGFLLSLTTAILWGILPIFLQICLEALDSASITWLRFFFAGAFVFLLLAKNRALPNILRQGSKTLIFALLGALLLVVNYVANVESLAYVSPETVQVVMQIAPIMLMIGGILFYKERLNRVELIGVIVLFSGLSLFFSPNLDALLSSGSQYNQGILFVLLAAAAWAGYALLQKSLLRSFTAKQLTLLIYVVGVCALLPFIHLQPLSILSWGQWGALLFACLNTVIAYGCFTEALHVWNASKVSAVVATAPVFTFLSVAVAQWFYPQQFSMIDLNASVVIGAMAVVVGSIMTAMAKQKS